MKQAFSKLAAAALVCALAANPGCAQGATDAGPAVDAGPADGRALAIPGDSQPETAQPFEGCATSTLVMARSPIFLEFVIDASGSMKGDKWTALVAALDGIFDDMLVQADPKLGVGMLVFSDTKDATIGTGPYPVTTANGVDKYNDVAIGYVDQAHRDALRRRVDAPVYASLLTPTLAALKGGFSVLESLAPAAPLPRDGRKVLVLMTDGMPSDDGNDESHPLVRHERGLALPVGPVLTFPVAIGDFSDIDPAWMGSLAVDGGTAFAGCNPNEDTNPKKLCYFQVVPSGKTVPQLTVEFMDTIKRIRAQAAVCELSLASDEAKADPTHVNVVVKDAKGNDTIVAQDPANGWTFDDASHPTKVILNGTACANAAADVDGSVEVVLGCKTLLF